MRFLAPTLAFLAGALLLGAAPQDEGRPVAPDVVEVTPAPVRPADAAALFAAFARMEGLEARFEEEKHVALLAAPLTSRGTIYFLPPGHLARVVTAPESTTLRITPDELVVESAEGVERIDLRRSDDVRRFVTSLVRVFAGDRAALERSYDVAYGADPDADDDAAWRLTLTPKAKPLTEMMRSLRLFGRGVEVRAIEVTEPTGDRTVTTIVEADPARRFTAEEKERLFGLSAP